MNQLSATPKKKNPTAVTNQPFIQKKGNSDEPFFKQFENENNVFGKEELFIPPSRNQQMAQLKASESRLPEEIQSKAASIFGENFSNIHVHNNSAAALQMQSLAFAQGNNLHFAPGYYSPATSKGQELIGHELTHVMQQRKGSVQPTAQIGNILINDSEHLEEEANKKGQEFAANNTYKNEPQNNSSGTVTNNSGVIQGFKMGFIDRVTYPKFRTFVENEMPRKHNDARIVAKLNQFGTNTGPTRQNIQSQMQWNKGPTINVTALDGANGEFSPGIGSTELRLDDTIVTAYQHATSGLDAHELFLESTVLHEYTHFLDDQDGTDRDGEEGQGFEEATYGRDIDSVSDARQVLNASYGSGLWTIAILDHNASFQQRFIVSGATSGNGTFEVLSSFTHEVEGPASGNWRIKIQNNDGSGWRNSELRNVRERAGEYSLRSEDWRDSDFNDLVLSVKK